MKRCFKCGEWLSRSCFYSHPQMARPGLDYGDTVVDPGRTFDLDEASPLERGLYNMCLEVEQLPASAFQTRLSLALSTAMIEVWRMRQRLAAHAVQCPQCHRAALEAAHSTNRGES